MQSLCTDLHSVLYLHIAIFASGSFVFFQDLKFKMQSLLNTPWEESFGCKAVGSSFMKRFSGLVRHHKTHNRNNFLLCGRHL